MDLRWVAGIPPTKPTGDSLYHYTSETGQIQAKSPVSCLFDSYPLYPLMITSETGQ